MKDARTRAVVEALGGTAALRMVLTYRGADAATLALAEGAYDPVLRGTLVTVLADRARSGGYPARVTHGPADSLVAWLRAGVPPIVLLASGTGFAPIKAILEHMQFKGINRPVSLYWGGRRPGDLYLDAWVQEQCRQMPQLRYVPVVSDALLEDAWSGRTGFVHRAVMADFPDMSGHQVYACGAPIMVESAQKDFVAQCGLPEDEFYADAFTSEADKHAAG